MVELRLFSLGPNIVGRESTFRFSKPKGLELRKEKIVRLNITCGFTGRNPGLWVGSVNMLLSLGFIAFVPCGSSS